MNFKKIGKVLTGKFVGTGPSSYKKRIYRAAVSQRLRNTGLDDSRGRYFGKVSTFLSDCTDSREKAANICTGCCENHVF